MFLQPLKLQERTVPHFKDLIHISLEPEVQGCVRLLVDFRSGQSSPISYHTEANGCIVFAAGVIVKIYPQNLHTLD